jgi:hypothetical protein
MNAKAEEQAKVATALEDPRTDREKEAKAAAALKDARTDREKLADIGLSDEEVAALEGEEEPKAADKGEAGKDADKPTEKEKKEAEDAKGDKPAEGEAAGAGEAGGEAEKDKEPATEKVPDHFTPMAETLTEDDLTMIDDEMGTIKKAFDDGDIDYEAYTDQRLKLEKLIWHHEQAELQNEGAVEQRWQWERDWYLQSNAELNQSQVIYGAFAAQVNALLADEEWNTAPGFDLLSEAHRRVSAEIDSLVGPGSGAAMPNGRPPAGEKDDADQKAKKALKAAKAAEADKRPPTTLARVPAAKDNADVSRWSAIDNLEGEEFQKAIDNLSPKDLKEYEESH